MTSPWFKVTCWSLLRAWARPAMIFAFPTQNKLPTLNIQHCLQNVQIKHSENLTPSRHKSPSAFLGITPQNIFSNIQIYSCCVKSRVQRHHLGIRSAGWQLRNRWTAEWLSGVGRLVTAQAGQAGAICLQMLRSGLELISGPYVCIILSVGEHNV